MDDAAAARQRERLHVVVFPWLAFGHLIPFLELAKRLAAPGHAPAPQLFHDVPHDKVELLRAAFDGLAAPFAAFLADACAAGAEDAAGFDRKADWIVVDFPHHWVPPIAHKYEVCKAFQKVFLKKHLLRIKYIKKY
uniref:Uncharacterized protein n=1 Tax=Oryza brachyantha TaxID=4533 RepID=J3MJB1_ORYBR